MPANEISPVLSTFCLLAMRKSKPDTVAICRAEPDQVTAHDDYGVALMESAHEPAKALKEFDAAIRFALQGLEPADAEWAELYWHRGRRRWAKTAAMRIAQ